MPPGLQLAERAAVAQHAWPKGVKACTRSQYTLVHKPRMKLTGCNDKAAIPEYKRQTIAALKTPGMQGKCCRKAVLASSHLPLQHLSVPVGPQIPRGSVIGIIPSDLGPFKVVLWDLCPTLGVRTKYNPNTFHTDKHMLLLIFQAVHTLKAKCLGATSDPMS